MELDLADKKPALGQAMGWFLQAISHYLSKCWPRYLSPYGVIRPQCVFIYLHAWCCTSQIYIIYYNTRKRFLHYCSCSAFFSVAHRNLRKYKVPLCWQVWILLQQILCNQLYKQKYWSWFSNNTTWVLGRLEQFVSPLPRQIASVPTDAPSNFIPNFPVD